MRSFRLTSEECVGARHYSFAHAVRATLTRTAQDADGLTSHADTELWRVEWDNIGAAGRNNTSRATRRRRHGDMSRILLALRAEGPDVADVYRDNC